MNIPPFHPILFYYERYVNIRQYSTVQRTSLHSRMVKKFMKPRGSSISASHPVFPESESIADPDIE